MATAEPTDHIGARIRYWRRRRGGMSQTTLARLAGLSQSFISNVESGHKSVERRSTLVALADALKVSVPELLGQPGDPTDSRHAGAAVSAIRASLVEIEAGERRTPTRGTDGLTAAISHLSELRSRAECAGMARLLPELLLEAAAHGGVHLAQVGIETVDVLKNYGYRDLARCAARIAVTGAEDADVPAWIGATRYHYANLLPAEAPGVASRIAEQALRDLQAKASDPNVRQTLGQLHLSASLACAVDKRPDDSTAHLREAEREARTLGDPGDGVGFNFSCFGPTNVGLWRMAVAVELGEHGKTVELAGKLDPNPLRMADRHYYYWLDYGRALAHSGKTDSEARAAFFRAEQAAPVHFSLNPMAHDAVLAMMNRAKRDAIPKDLRVLAHRLGIETTGFR
jgi:transcriptional regulator with XRE-family HTH domain